MISRIILFVCVLFLISSAQGQNIFEKWRIIRSVKYTNKELQEKADKKLLQVNYEEHWRNKYKILYLYHENIEYINKYKDGLNKSMLDSLKLNLLNVNLVINNYKECRDDTVFLIKRGFIISEFYDFKNQLLNRIYQLELIDSLENNRYIDSLKNEYIIDSLENQISMKNEYESPAVLDSLTNIFLPLIIDSVFTPPKNGFSGTEYLIEIKREGENAKDLVVKLSLFYREDLYGYPLGIYRSPALNYPIKIFSLIVKNRIRASSSVRISITGEADSNIPEGLIYDGYYGNIIYENYYITSGREITNQELAFLRAYNAKMIFEDIINIDTERIKTIDHIQFSDENKGFEFRKVTMIAYFSEYFSAFNELSDEAKKALNIDMKTICIQNDNIIVIRD